MEKTNKKRLKSVLKLSFTLLALYIVFSKVSLGEVVKQIIEANIWYLLLAFISFNLSKILSSIRLNYYFRHIGIVISERYALVLYYIGMFYNLFLPGGIGGDGYKIYLLKKRNDHVSVKRLLSATLLDRISGLIPLLFLGGILFVKSDYYTQWQWLDMLVIIDTIVVFPTLYVMMRIFFRDYLTLFFKTTLLGTMVQLLQLLSAFFIVYSIGVSHLMIIFLTLFLLSSVVAVLPISLGGVGIRELTFLYGLSLLSLNVNDGIVFSLLFFMITALSSFIGIFLKE